jgi:hypothetical protein
MGQQPRSWPAALDRSSGKWGLNYGLAAPAGEPWPDKGVDDEPARHKLQLLSHILTKGLEVSATAWAWADNHLRSRQVIWKRLAPGRHSARNFLGRSVWNKRYSRSLTDLFGFQGEVQLVKAL